METQRDQKESQRVSYEELEDNLDDLDQLPARTMQYHDRERKTTPLIQEPLDLACIALFFNTLFLPPICSK